MIVYRSYWGGFQLHIDGPLQMKYWGGVLTPATAAALTPSMIEHDCDIISSLTMALTVQS